MKRESEELPRKIYVGIYRRVPRLCVDAVIRTPRGVLLARRDIPPNAGRWYLPGGRVRKHETLARAARRVCAEELGISAVATKTLGVIEYLREPRGRGFVSHSVSVVLAARIAAGTPAAIRQARRIGFFRSSPAGTQPEVRKFLISSRLCRR